MIRPPVSAAQTCVPFPYGAGQQDQILKGQPCRQDLLAATERRDLLFCTARPGVRFHAGAAETYRFRPAPNRERVQSAGTEIIRMDSRTQRGFIDSWDEFEAGFRVPKRHKKSKGRDNIPARRHWDTVAKKCTAPLQVPSTKDGTKQGLATFIPSLKNSQFLLARYKELLLFIMSVGYAELYKCKVSIISVFSF